MTLKEEDLKIMANMVGIVACLVTTASPLLSRLLAEYLGENQMLAIVCQSSVTTPENYERALNSVAADLGKHITGSYLLICLEDIRPYAGDVRTSDPQKRLGLPKPELPDGKTPPGFLGYAVNMIEIDVDHLETKTAAGYGLRETLFYGLFGELQVYDCKENMKLARGCIKDGAVSLNGGIIRGNGIISLGCKQVDVHFPVTAVDHRLIVSTESKEIIRLVEKKKAADEAIAYTCEMRSKCMKQFQEVRLGF